VVGISSSFGEFIVAFLLFVLLSFNSLYILFAQDHLRDPAIIMKTEKTNKVRFHLLIFTEKVPSVVKS